MCCDNISKLNLMEVKNCMHTRTLLAVLLPTVVKTAMARMTKNTGHLFYRPKKIVTLC